MYNNPGRVYMPVIFVNEWTHYSSEIIEVSLIFLFFWMHRLFSHLKGTSKKKYLLYKKLWNNGKFPGASKTQHISSRSVKWSQHGSGKKLPKRSQSHRLPCLNPRFTALEGMFTARYEKLFCMDSFPPQKSEWMPPGWLSWGCFASTSLCAWSGPVWFWSIFNWFFGWYYTLHVTNHPRSLSFSEIQMFYWSVTWH